MLLLSLRIRALTTTTMTHKSTKFTGLHLLAAAAMCWGLTGCGGGGDAPFLASAPDRGVAPLPAPVAATTPAPPVVISPGAPISTTPALADFSCGLNGAAGIEAEVLQRVNAFRAAGAVCGTKVFPAATALSWNTTLLLAAKGHSTDMAQKNYFAHVSQDGRSASQRATAAGYNWANFGENIAGGQRSVEEVITGWANSPGHCENLMNPNFRDVAVACVRNDAADFRLYWTMNLGRSR